MKETNNYLSEDEIKELSEDIQDKIDELAEIGNSFFDDENYEEALKVWKQGLDLIPDPKQDYEESIWFFASIGDIYFLQENYEQAHACFDMARSNITGGGYNNPFVMLRLGESCLEIGDEKNALEYMLRAYMFAGEEIFSYEDKKYFNFLKAHVQLN